MTTPKKQPEGFKLPEGYERGLLPPVLPSNVKENEIFRRVPELFTGVVDGSQNHWNENGFFNKLAAMGLTIESLRLEEKKSWSLRRQAEEITEFEILPEEDAIRIKAADGRKLQLRIQKYRIEHYPYDRPMKDLESVDIFSLTDNTSTAFLSFAIRKLPS